MGFFPVNRLALRRDYDRREIVVIWHDDLSGEREKRFTFEQENEVMALVKREFFSLAM